MKIPPRLVIPALVFLLAACSPSPKTAILGTWESLDGGISEFMKDGTVTFKAPRGSVAGKWDIPSNDILKITISPVGLELTQTGKLEFIDQDTFKWTPENGATDVLKRVRL